MSGGGGGDDLREELILSLNGKGSSSCETTRAKLWQRKEEEEEEEEEEEREGLYLLDFLLLGSFSCCTWYLLHETITFNLEAKDETTTNFLSIFIIHLIKRTIVTAQTISWVVCCAPLLILIYRLERLLSMENNVTTVVVAVSYFSDAFFTIVIIKREFKSVLLL